MKPMDTLPKPTTTSSLPVSPPPPVGSMAKEVTPVSENTEVSRITEIGKEVELPPEVKKAGVTIKSDTVILPKPVAQMGVTPVGSAAPVSSPPTKVPLTDDQIAQGLHQSILSSWRWLAEWCARQVKLTHKFVTTIQGKGV